MLRSIGELGEAGVLRLEWINLRKGLDEAELKVEFILSDFERGVTRESTLLFLLLILRLSGESRQDNDSR